MNSTRQADVAARIAPAVFRDFLSSQHILLRRTRVWAAAGGLLLFCATAAAPPSSVTLAWDPSPSGQTNVSGYNLYWGPRSLSYTNYTFVPGWGNNTVTITNLLPGATYYFGITATNTTNRLESVFDGEVFTTIPTTPLPVTNLRIRLWP